MQIKTSYFYQIRNFTPNLIPVSTCLSDPEWYKPKNGKEYFIDKNGVINGLRYEPLIIQKQCAMTCPCNDPDWLNRAPACPTMQEYEKALFSLVDKERTLKAFEFCANKFALPFGEEPIIVLMVYEPPAKKCSERYALQKFFNCKELEFPIK